MSSSSIPVSIPQTNISDLMSKLKKQKIDVQNGLKKTFTLNQVSLNYCDMLYMMLNIIGIVLFAALYMLFL